MIPGLVSLFLQIFTVLILARILMSWVQVDPYNPVVRFIFNVTEPLLKPVRDLLPPVSGFDFSPIVLMVLMQVIASIIISAYS